MTASVIKLTLVKQARERISLPAVSVKQLSPHVTLPGLHDLWWNSVGQFTYFRLLSNVLLQRFHIKYYGQFQITNFCCRFCQAVAHMALITSQTSIMFSFLQRSRRVSRSVILFFCGFRSSLHWRALCVTVFAEYLVKFSLRCINIDVSNFKNSFQPYRLMKCVYNFFSN